ncbi:MAG: hypothetical protein ACTSUE_23220 [Promethearchaeota archaeon]
MDDPAMPPFKGTPSLIKTSGKLELIRIGKSLFVMIEELAGMPMVKLVAEFTQQSSNTGPGGEPFTYEIIYPSTSVKKFFKKNDLFSAMEFIQKAILAMKEANKRVLEKYGFSCFGCKFAEDELMRFLGRKDIGTMNVLIKALVG